MAEAACSRANLQLLLASRKEVARLAEVEALLAGEACLARERFGLRPTPGRRRPDASAGWVWGR